MVMAHPEPLHPEDCKCPVCGHALHWPGSRRTVEPLSPGIEPGPSTVDYYCSYTASTYGTNNPIPIPFNTSHLGQCRAVRHILVRSSNDREYTCSCGEGYMNEHELMLHFRDHEHDWPKILTLAEMEDM